MSILNTYLLRKQDFDIIDKREHVNFLLSNEKGLDFDFKDIKYIILKCQSEKQNIVDLMVDVFLVKEIDVYKNIVFITKEIIAKDL